MEDKDVLSLSAEEFCALDDFRLQEALQLIVGRMAVAQTHMRATSEAYHAYLSAKDEFTRLRQMGSVLQTLLRTKTQV